MIGKDDWDAATSDFMARERERLGGPPSAEDVVAFARGELTGAQAERVRTLLVYYPELLAPLPEAGDEVLTDLEVARDWEKLQARIAATNAPVIPLPLRQRPEVARIVAIAASVVLLFVAPLLVKSRIDVARLTRELSAPHALGERHQLLPMAEPRGTPQDAYELPPDEREYRIAPALLGDTTYSRYRVELVDVESGRTIWKGEDLRVAPGAELEISIPRAFVDPGVYRLDVYGRNGKAPRQLGQYLLRVPK
jgi:hypothetical protein